MPQCLDADSPAFSNSDKPTRDTVGTMVSGVTYFTILPIIPGNCLSIENFSHILFLVIV